MDKPQRLVSAFGVLALIVLCLFPYSRYIAVIERPDHPITVKGPDGKHVAVNTVDFESRSGFRPIWEKADFLGMERPGLSFGLGIHWPVFLGMLASVVVIIVAAVRVMRRRGRTTSAGSA